MTGKSRRLSGVNFVHSFFRRIHSRSDKTTTKQDQLRVSEYQTKDRAWFWMEDCKNYWDHLPHPAANQIVVSRKNMNEHERTIQSNSLIQETPMKHNFKEQTTRPLNTLELWIECQAAIFSYLWLWNNHLWKASSPSYFWAPLTDAKAPHKLWDPVRHCHPPTPPDIESRY